MSGLGAVFLNGYLFILEGLLNFDAACNKVGLWTLYFLFQLFLSDFGPNTENMRKSEIWGFFFAPSPPPSILSITIVLYLMLCF